MPKYDAGHPKAIANRWKAKGLQKLKWYCQMCNKQCRDENGFKCHKMSESHVRMMRIFVENPGRHMNEFSRDFKHGFVGLLKLKGGRRVKANDVYQQYIKDKSHVHMNATVWTTLTGFIMFLSKQGLARIDHVDDGTVRGTWYVQYIDRDPQTAAKQRRVKELQKDEMRQRKADSRRIEQILKERKKRAVEREQEQGQSDSCLMSAASGSGTKKTEDIATVSKDTVLSFGPIASATLKPTSARKRTLADVSSSDVSSSVVNATDSFSTSSSVATKTGAATTTVSSSASSSTFVSGTASKKSAPLKSPEFAEIDGIPPKRKRRFGERITDHSFPFDSSSTHLAEGKRSSGTHGHRHGKDTLADAKSKNAAVCKWTQGIVVKMKSSGKKGAVVAVHSERDSVDIDLNLKKKKKKRKLVDNVPLADLQTVIPALGRRVRVLSTAKDGVLQSVDQRNCCGNIMLDGSSRTLSIPYDDFSKTV